MAPGLSIRGVELFASGEYRGRRWTVADLDEMAANCRRLGPSGLRLLAPPAVLGHEEDQDFLDRTDAPAAAWLDCDSVRVRRYYEPATGRTEGVLVGDLTAVTPAAAHLIRAGAYRKVSAEIYDDFQDDFGRGHGKALRRVALLGGEVPQVKRLADLPAVTAHSDRHPARLTPVGVTRSAAGTLLCFAETSPMDRTQLLTAVQAAMPGIAQATLDAMTDDQLADLVKNLPAPATPPADVAMADPQQMIDALVAAGQDPAAVQALDPAALEAAYAQLNPDAAGDVATMGDPAVMTREELIAELTAAGQDPATLDALTDDDLKKMYAELGLGSVAAAPVDAAAPAPVAMGERGRRGHPLANVARLNAFAELQHRQLRRRAAQMQRDDAVRFCEQLCREGRILPAQKSDYLTLLTRLDDTRPVVRFSEGGRTTTRTAYEAKKAELSRRAPVVRFGEKVPGAGPAAATTDAAEVRKVERFAEVHAAALKAAGQTPQVFVHRFSEARKKDPSLTARKYGVPAEFCS